MDTTDGQKSPGLKLLRRMTPKFALIVLGLAALLFVPAGTLAYWQAWVFLAAILGPMTAVLIYLATRDPGLLERRLQAREKEAPQKFVQKAGGVFMTALIVLPGLDRRWGWSHVPVAVVLTGVVVFVTAYLSVFWVFRVNSYASRTVEVVPGQTLISTGPYAIVRHPMYLGSLILYLAMPVALGSIWALLAYLPLPLIFAVRIRNEEEVLVRDLPGYAEYRAKVRFKAREVWSLTDAREALADLIGGNFDWIAFDDWLAQVCLDRKLLRSARASTFSASLELMREGKIELRQEKTFAPIYIRGAVSAALDGAAA